MIFLSYNKADREVARRLSAQLKLVGADVWLDEWEVKAGDSIPGRLNAGLSDFGVFVLIWSEDAAKSHWVRRELESAIARGIGDDQVRIIPARVDETALPPLLADLRYIRLDDVGMAVDEIMGFRTGQQRLIAIQAALEEADIEVGYFEGYGPIVGCPRCGAAVDRITGWEQTDYRRDDRYAGAKCTVCGWSCGGEV